MAIQKLNNTQLRKYRSIFKTDVGEMNYLNKTVQSFIILSLKKKVPSINLTEVVKPDHKAIIRNKLYLTNNIINKEYHMMMYENLKKIDDNGAIKEEESENDEEEYEFNKFEDTYYLEDEFTSKEINEIYYRSAGAFDLKYLFDKKVPLTNEELNVNINSLQRINITILQQFGTFNEYARLEYRCPKCGFEFTKSLNHIESNDLVKCPARNIETGKICGGSCKNPTNNSDKFNMNIYQGVFTTKNLLTKKYEDKNIIVFSHKDLDLVEYDAIILSKSSGQKQYLQLLDAKPIVNNIVDFESLFNLKPKEGVDLVLDTIKFFDKTIRDLSGKNIIGMYDIKFALIRQKMIKHFKWPLIDNIALRGDRSTGKTMILDKYSYLLYNNQYKSTKGTNTSVPALRGSSNDMITHRDMSMQPPGLLSVYSSITIDEVNADPNLVRFLKGMLLGDEVSNDKAGSNKTIYPKTAHLNITENVDSDHQSRYEFICKKEYEAMSGEVNPTDTDSVFNQLSDWSADWDLLQPITSYGNKRLMKAIETARKNAYFADKHWLYGCDMADLDRFSVNFYLTNTKSKDMRIKKGDSTVEEFYASKSKKDLFVGNINEVFEYYRQFVRDKIDFTVLQKIRKMLDDYFEGDINERLELRYYIVADCSRILNKRMNFTDTDIKHLYRFLSLSNRAVAIEEMNNLDAPAQFMELKK